MQAGGEDAPAKLPPLSSWGTCGSGWYCRRGSTSVADQLAAALLVAANGESPDAAVWRRAAQRSVICKRGSHLVMTAAGLMNARVRTEVENNADPARCLSPS